MQSLTLNRNTGGVCTFPESSVLITLVEGAIPEELNESPDKEWFGATIIQTSTSFDSSTTSEPGDLLTESGFLNFVNKGTHFEPDFAFKIPFSNTKSRFQTYEDLKQYVQVEEHNEDDTTSNQRMRTMFFNLKRAIYLIERYSEEELKNIVFFRPIQPKDDKQLALMRMTSNSSSIGDAMYPGRLDVCACQNILQCPEGTATISLGASSIEDCVENGNEIVHRVSLVHSKKVEDKSDEHLKSFPDIYYSTGFESTIQIEAYDIAIFNINLSQLPRNMTYGKHYKLSVYKNCIPCPNKYRCTNKSQCTHPSLDVQRTMLNNCLTAFRAPVCVHRNGTDVSMHFCTDQTSGEEDFMIYSRPELKKCASMPYFCEEKSWGSLRFRKLCQDQLSDGKKSIIYDCSWVQRWEEFMTWSKNYCVVANQGQSCVKEACMNGSVHNGNGSKSCLYAIFEKEFGYPPPPFEPKGSFIMDSVVQEDKANLDPFSLFNKECNGTCKGDIHKKNPFNDEARISHIQSKGCCNCKPHPLPAFFESRHETASGFTDNKHYNISFTISALESVDLLVVFELLNGKFIKHFTRHFEQAKGVFTHRVHSPQRFSQGSTRSQWLTILNRELFEQRKMNLPMNLPIKGTSQTSVTLENSILIDRPCQSLLLPTAQAATESTNFTIKNHSAYRRSTPSSNDSSTSNISSNQKQQRIQQMLYYNDDGKDIDKDMCVLDEYDVMHMSENVWWKSETISNDDNYAFSAIALPYLPFFSNCDSFDSHLSLSRLIEEHPDCTTVSHHDTNEVRQISISRENDPFGDHCMTNKQPNEIDFLSRMNGAGLKCQFEENINFASDYVHWYESKSESVLFYFTADAIPSDLFIAQEFENLGTIMSLPWGRSPEILHGQTVPVRVSKNFGGIKNVVPRHVTLDLQYYQIDRFTKRLVSATIYFDRLCTTLKPEHFGGDPHMLLEMKEMNILPCEADINGEIKSKGYTLHIALYPLDWFNLLNTFQFHGSIYFAYFTLAGVASVFIGFTVWGLNRVTTKLRHLPTFHARSLLKLIAEPSFFGSSLAIVALMSCTMACLLVLNKNSSIWENIPSDWYINFTPTDDKIRMMNKGRIGTVLLVVGIHVTITGASFIIQKQTPIKLQDDEDDFLIVSENKKIPQTESWAPIKWKRAHFVQSCFVLEFYLLCLWELSYSSVFEENLYQITLLSKIAFVIADITITKSLKEKLLCSPLLISIGISEVVIILASSDFVEFTILYFIQIATGILHRLYIDPCVKVVGCLWPRWKFVLMKKMRTRGRMSVHQKRQEEKKWRQINEAIELRNEGVEPLIDAISLSSISIIVRILVPIVLMLFSAFYDESQIAELYTVSNSQVSYYALFTACMIPWSFLVDVVVFNAEELAFGFRMYDYLVYQRHRFGSRDFKWTLNISQFDESVLETLQSLDLMMFSSQYYFVSTLLSGSIITTIFGGTILLRTKEYSFLADPVLPMIIAMVLMIIKCLQNLFMFLASIKIKYIYWEGIWGSIEIEGTLDDMIATKLAIGEGRKVDLDKERLELEALNDDKFRQRFLDRNKPWLLRHLVELLTENEKDLTDKERSKLVAYTKDVYSDLLAMGEGDKRDGDRPDISSDDENDSDSEKRRNWDRNMRDGTSIIIAKLWLNKARKRHIFKQSIDDLMKSNQQSVCSSCLRGKQACQKLGTYLCRDGKYDPSALDSLIIQFEEECHSSLNDTLIWKSFFRQNAEILTLCNICMVATTQAAVTDHDNDDHTNEKINGSKQLITRPGDISSDDEDHDQDPLVFRPLIIDQKSSHSRLLQKWLIGARRKMGGSFPRPGAKVYSQTCIEKIKRYHGKKTFVATPATRQKKVLNQNISRDNVWGPIKIEENGKQIMSRWLVMARDNNQERFCKEGHTIRRSLRETLSKMETIDDWYYSEDLRLEGLRLQKEAQSISEEYELSISKELQALKDLEIEKENFVQSGEDRLRRLTIDLQNKKESLASTHQKKTSLRLMELQRAVDDTSLDNDHHNRLEMSITVEQKQANNEWDVIENKVDMEMEKITAAIQRDITAKLNDAKVEAAFIHEHYSEESLAKERKWREIAMKWLVISKSKVASKV